MHTINKDIIGHLCGFMPMKRIKNFLSISKYFYSHACEFYYNKCWFDFDKYKKRSLITNLDIDISYTVKNNVMNISNISSDKDIKKAYDILDNVKEISATLNTFTDITWNCNIKRVVLNKYTYLPNDYLKSFAHYNNITCIELRCYCSKIDWLNNCTNLNNLNVYGTAEITTLTNCKVLEHLVIGRNVSMPIDCLPHSILYLWLYLPVFKYDILVLSKYNLTYLYTNYKDSIKIFDVDGFNKLNVLKIKYGKRSNKSLDGLSRLRSVRHLTFLGLKFNEIISDLPPNLYTLNICNRNYNKKIDAEIPRTLENITIGTTNILK